MLRVAALALLLFGVSVAHAAAAASPAPGRDPRPASLSPQQFAAYGAVLDGLLGVRAAAERGEPTVQAVERLYGTCAGLPAANVLSAALGVDCLAIATVLRARAAAQCAPGACAGDVAPLADALRLSLAAGRAYNRALGVTLRPGACRSALRHDRAALAFQARLLAIAERVVAAEAVGDGRRGRQARERLATATDGRMASRSAIQVRSDLAVACRV